jgi:hypothetical protein
LHPPPPPPLPPRPSATTRCAAAGTRRFGGTRERGGRIEPTSAIHIQIVSCARLFSGQRRVSEVSETARCLPWAGNSSQRRAGRSDWPELPQPRPIGQLRAAVGLAESLEGPDESLHAWGTSQWYFSPHGGNMPRPQLRLVGEPTEISTSHLCILAPSVACLTPDSAGKNPSAGP